jgi:hypothetical protein
MSIVFPYGHELFDRRVIRAIFSGSYSINRSKIEAFEKHLSE